MFYWILTENEMVVSRKTVSRVTNLESQTHENKAIITALDKETQERLNDEAHIIVEGSKGEQKDWSEHPFDSNPNFHEESIHIVSNEEVAEDDNEFLPDVYDDTQLSMELDLPKRGQPEPHFAHVTKCLRVANGIPISKASDNPILDTRMYEVEYVDGKKYALSANLIAENMFAHIYEEGNRHMLMDKITDHWFDEAEVKSHDFFLNTSSGTNCRRQTTQGLILCIKWRYRNTTWMDLKDIKDTYPFQ